jgi:hypothetical protein
MRDNEAGSTSKNQVPGTVRDNGSQDCMTKWESTSLNSQSPITQSRLLMTRPSTELPRDSTYTD